MRFRLELGRAVRNELEFRGLLAADRKRVKASRNKYGELGKFRSIDWTDREHVQVGDWLWAALSEMTCFDVDERGYPKIADDHKAALDDLAEELVFKHPLYMPLPSEPPPWTSWRVEYDGQISVAFVKTNGDPDTEEAIKLAFEDGPSNPTQGPSVQSSVCRLRSIPRCSTW